MAEYLEVPGWAECTVDRLLSRDDPELDEFPPVEEVVDLSRPYSEQPDLHAQANLAGLICSQEADWEVAAKIEDEAGAAGVAVELRACVRLELMEWRPAGGYLPDAVTIEKTGELPPQMTAALPGAVSQCEGGESPWVTYDPQGAPPTPTTAP